ISRPVLTYGESEDADFRIHDVRQQEARVRFRVSRPDGKPELEATLNMPGRHNVLNATAAIAVATDEGIDDGAILAGLLNFQGVGRRFDILGQLALREG